MKINKLLVGLVLATFAFLNSTYAQKLKEGILPEILHEVSGLEFYTDSILIAHNDGGDGPKLYFLNKKGHILHTVFVDNALNIDWEDIAFDGKNTLYIADFGNNNNDRRDLCIYKIDTKDILTKSTVTAEKISISYKEQNAFPPQKSELRFDAESITFYNGQLYIFTKCRTEPFDGKSYCYVAPTEPGEYTLERKYEITLGKDGWWKDSFTAAEYADGKFYILTYNSIIIFKLENGKFEKLEEIMLDPVSQYEAITVDSNGKIFLADERNKLIGGGNIYHFKESKKK